MCTRKIKEVVGLAREHRVELTRKAKHASRNERERLKAAIMKKLADGGSVENLTDCRHS